MQTPETPPPEPKILQCGNGATIAYHAVPPSDPRAGPTVVFCTGFRSDMTGSKATRLEEACRVRGQGFVRFDYRGHGASSGSFRDGSIGDWAADAVAVLDHVAAGRLLLVGSSMGGWIMLLAALARPERVAGLVGIAAAPDFTADLMDAAFTAEQHAALRRDGVLMLPSAYGEPTPITRHLIEEGRSHLLLRRPIPLNLPVRLLQGMADPDVPWQTALRLAEALQGGDIRVTLVKDGDHRLSREADLQLLCDTVAGLSDSLAAADAVASAASPVR